MLTKRIIPCLDVDRGRVVKGIKFFDHVDAGDPVAQADFELAIFIGTIAERERLIIGFNGASARTLHSVVDPQAYAAHNIDIDDPEWIDEHVQSDHGISKLLSYLDQPQLSLRMAIDTFLEAFVGEAGHVRRA